MIKNGNANPFDQDEIVLCSYHFARNKADYLSLISWDLVVIDEAHRLRNVYKKSNKIANAIKRAIFPYKKILLTATPLQNSLLELFGLVSIIDDYKFGDMKSFKNQFIRLNNDDVFNQLRERIQPICKRTLRKQVLEYIRYTNRIPITQKFEPSDEEQTLYRWISEYLQRESLKALPPSQRTLMTLVLRKLLASSTYAIAGALKSLHDKLEKKLSEFKNIAGTETQNEIDENDLFDDIKSDFETFNEFADEWETEEGEAFTIEDIKKIEDEVGELKAFYELAVGIQENAKGEKLFTALEAGFKKAKELGGSEKAVVFTESKRTQDYLLKKLSENGYKNKIALFNGTNNDEISKEIYKSWIANHKGTDKITGSRTVDMRAALVDYFKNNAKIMIATEAAAEGINLQFCSIVVNYDMPWNPQRIEQRIGRCHRYGQKHDVVVVNFLNTKNRAEARIYQLLNEKFKLFKGVFGASDEVLGVIESGVDFEKKILEIYQKCRTPEEIESAFDNLQNDMEEQIGEKMQSTRQTLLENFDAEVHDKLKFNKEKSEEYLNKYQSWLFKLTEFVLKDKADFHEDGLSFTLNENDFDKQISLGRYKIGNHVEDSHIYRIQHPLAQKVIKGVKNQKLPAAEIHFKYTGTPIISILEKYIGKSGWLLATSLSVDSFEKEDHVVLSAITDDNNILDEDECRRLFSLQADVVENDIENKKTDSISEIYQKKKEKILAEINVRNDVFFDEEMDKLERWADDLKSALELELRDLDLEIKTKKAEARKIQTLQKKVEAQREIKQLETQRKEKRKKLFTSQDEVEERKESLISDIEQNMDQKIKEEELFLIRFEISGDK